MSIPDYVKEQQEYLVSLRRYFHRYPELSLEEFNTASKIEEELDKRDEEKWEAFEDSLKSNRKKKYYATQPKSEE